MTGRRIDPFAYDRHMGRRSRRLADRFVDFVGLEPDQRWLDIGRDTGAPALSVAARSSTARLIAAIPACLIMNLIASCARKP